MHIIHALQDSAIVVVRIKDRINTPWGGGWRGVLPALYPWTSKFSPFGSRLPCPLVTRGLGSRPVNTDIMINYYFVSDEAKHVCELQLVHAPHRVMRICVCVCACVLSCIHAAYDACKCQCAFAQVHSSMLTARKGLPGHVIYNVVRNASELKFATTSSTGHTLLHPSLHHHTRTCTYMSYMYMHSGELIERLLGGLSEEERGVGVRKLREAGSTTTLACYSTCLFDFYAWLTGSMRGRISSLSPKRSEDIEPVLVASAHILYPIVVLSRRDEYHRAEATGDINVSFACRWFHRERGQGGRLYAPYAGGGGREQFKGGRG